MRFFQILMIVMATIMLSMRFAFSQGAADYPIKVVRVIVATSPGGGVDIQARMFAQKLSEILKHQFVVENRPGAEGTIGFGVVAKSAPDGYTLLAVSPAFTLTPALHPNFPYHPAKDFASISVITKAPYLLLAHPGLPVKSAKELITLARSKPGALDVGDGGGFGHLAAAYFASAANIKVTRIPYNGTGPLMMAAIGGHIHIFFANVLSTLSYVKSGRLRALAVTSLERSSVLPELPTISESGARGYDVTTWHGWLAPAGTPVAILNKLSEELSKAVKSPDIIKTLSADGGEPVGSTPEQFRQLIAVEVPRWRKIVKDSSTHPK